MLINLQEGAGVLGEAGAMYISMTQGRQHHMTEMRVVGRDQELPWGCKSAGDQRELAGDQTAVGNQSAVGDQKELAGDRKGARELPWDGKAAGEQSAVGDRKELAWDRKGTRELPWDGKAAGELQARGPLVCPAYHGVSSRCLIHASCNRTVSC